MTVRNRDIAKILEEVADLLEIRGSGRFRVRAYREAAQMITESDRRIAEMVCDDDDDISSLPGVGESLSAKIREIVETGELTQLDELRDSMDAGVRELLRVPDIGPARARALYQELGITDADGIIEAAESGRIQRLDGFGCKIEEQLSQNARRFLEADSVQRLPIGEADSIVEPLLAHLRDHDAVSTVEVAGSYRRRAQTVGDIDILAVCSDQAAVMDAFAAYDRVDRILSRGETRSSVVLDSGVQVDLRAVSADSYGAALYYFTGSKDHNVAVRRIAQEQGLKINEYGVFDGERRIAGGTEESVFSALGLPFIVPELREDRGEIEAGQEGSLPQLVTAQDIKGDLHTHSAATDGTHSLHAMADAAKELGYRYIAVTDHSKRSRVADGLDEDDLLRQVDEIAELDDELAIRILSGVEVDILEDGSLDLSDSVLEKLEVVIGSVHYGLQMSAEKMTRRVLAAMDNPALSILGHPTGRLLGKRAAYRMDLERVLEAACERGVLVELNAHPQRLDLDDRACRSVADGGGTIAVGTDAHSIGGLHHMRYGVDVARRGWLASDDVANTRDTASLLKLLR